MGEAAPCEQSQAIKASALGLSAAPPNDDFLLAILSYSTVNALGTEI